MKRLFHIAIMLGLLLALVPVSASAHMGGYEYSRDLIAGGGNEKSEIDAGDVLVWNNADYLYVKFVTTAPWCLLETHVAVGDLLEDIPQTKKGNPIPGNFAYAEIFELDPCQTEHTFKIPLADVGGVLEQELFIATHAVVVDTTSEMSETLVFKPAMAKSTIPAQLQPQVKQVPAEPSRPAPAKWSTPEPLTS